MTNPVNVVMVALLVALACGAAFVRLQPPLMRQLADWLNARADSEDWFEGRHMEYKQKREKPSK